MKTIETKVNELIARLTGYAQDCVIKSVDLAGEARGIDRSTAAIQDAFAPDIEVPEVEPSVESKVGTTPSLPPGTRARRGRRTTQFQRSNLERGKPAIMSKVFNILRLGGADWQTAHDVHAADISLPLDSIRRTLEAGVKAGTLEEKEKGSGPYRVKQ
jgi:hypothetical protein